MPKITKPAAAKQTCPRKRPPFKFLQADWAILEYLESSDQCLMLQSIRYLVQQKARAGERYADHFFEGHFWIYDSMESWVERFHWLSESTIRRNLKALVAAGLLIKKQERLPHGGWGPCWFTSDETRCEAISAGTEPSEAVLLPGIRFQFLGVAAPSLRPGGIFHFQTTPPDSSDAPAFKSKEDFSDFERTPFSFFERRVLSNLRFFFTNNSPREIFTENSTERETARARAGEAGGGLDDPAPLSLPGTHNQISSDSKTAEVELAPQNSPDDAIGTPPTKEAPDRTEPLANSEAAVGTTVADRDMSRVDVPSVIETPVRIEMMAPTKIDPRLQAVATRWLAIAERHLQGRRKAVTTKARFEEALADVLRQRDDVAIAHLEAMVGFVAKSPFWTANAHDPTSLLRETDSGCPKLDSILGQMPLIRAVPAPGPTPDEPPKPRLSFVELVRIANGIS